MKNHLSRFKLFVILSLFCGSAAFAQTTVRGKVVDAETGDALTGATVTIAGTNKGVLTDFDGTFSINATPRETLSIKFLGFREVLIPILQGGTVELETIMLEPDIRALQDVIIASSVAIARKTPVAMTTIDPVQIEEKIGIQEFPELLRSSPGVYVIRQGGGYGDSQLFMRGFDAPNIAVMVNGIPMNDMEWGGLYWSNWTGLTDVTRSMQTQRGLGASKVSAPSVGGSINIITRSIDAKQGGAILYGMGNDGYNKLTFSVSTGLSPKGWAMTLLAGRTWGDGYIQGTEFNDFNYFFNIAKRINDSHQLSFTAFAAAQVHYQRSTYDGLTIRGWQEVKKFMEPGQQYKFNATYGYGKNGERKTSAKNKYHKPQLSLNHMWQITPQSSLSTVLYASLGDGWGYSGQGASSHSSSWYGTTNGILNTIFRNADGTFAYDQIQDLNENSPNGSLMVMSISKNQHQWFGLLSTYTLEVNNRWNIYAGVDGRYYKGIHTNEIIDLYNGAYYVDRYRKNVRTENNAAAADPDFVTQKLTVGDVVYRDYDGHVVQGGAFGQAEYSNDRLSAFVAGSASQTSQWRYDRFYYDRAHAKSDKVNKIGFTVKGGANYNLTNYHNVFANLGYISRAPFFSGGAFLSSTVSNVVNDEAVNEKIISFELGYGYQSKSLNVKVNVYHTRWNDKTMAYSQDYTDAQGNADRARINMTGVNATHEGIEVEVESAPYRWLDLSGMLSLGNWRWTNSPTGYFYNSGGQPLTRDYKVASGIKAEDHAAMKLILEGVKTGGSAQTTAKVGAKLKPAKGTYLSLDWFLFARNYANWSLSSSDISIGGEKKFVTPWRIPSANLFDLSGGYSFKLGDLNATLSGNLHNVFGQEYILSAYDGSDHTWETAYRVFYGFGRTWSMRLKVKF